MWRGKRLFNTAEIEGKLIGKTVKMLGDNPGWWYARAPHAPEGFHFPLAAVLCLSANVKIAFNIQDGGIERRAMAFAYKYVFKGPGRYEKTDPRHKKASEIDLKAKDVLAARRPRCLYFLLSIYRVWYTGRKTKLPGTWPLSVVHATGHLLASNHDEEFKAFLSREFVEAPNADEAVMRNYFVKQLMECDDLKGANYDDLLKRFVIVGSSSTVRDKVKQRKPNGAQGPWVGAK